MNKLHHLLIRYNNFVKQIEFNEVEVFRQKNSMDYETLYQGIHYILKTQKAKIVDLENVSPNHFKKLKDLYINYIRREFDIIDYRISY